MSSPRRSRLVPCLASLTLCLLAVAPGAPGQDDAEFDKDAFRSRKKWYVTFVLQLKGRGEATWQDDRGFSRHTVMWSILREVRGTFELDHIGHARPSDSEPVQGEKHERRFISWDASVAESDVTLLIRDRTDWRSLEQGEAFEAHQQREKEWGFTKLEGEGTTRIGRFKELKCDLKDMVFDFNCSGLRDLRLPSGARPFRLTGDCHRYHPVTKVSHDHEFEPSRHGGGMPGMLAPLERQLRSRKLVLRDGIIGFKASVPWPSFPDFPPQTNNKTPTGNAEKDDREGVGCSGRGSHQPPGALRGSPLELSLEVTISPTPPTRAKLILTPVGEPSAPYERWRPLCSDSEDKPGNSLQIGWRVEEEGGEPAQVERVRFLLVDTSDEPGVCGNWPHTPRNWPRDPLLPPDFDLKFSSPKAPERGREVRHDGQLLILSDEQARARKGTVEVECFDSGATGKLVAFADLKDGRQLKGVVEGTGGETELRIPDFDPGVSRTPRWWHFKHAAGKQDSNDDDDDPKGDGQPGDGLTVWEEYRGFRVGDFFEECDPQKKDFFIVDRVGGDAKVAIRKFELLSKLNVHDELRDDQVSSSRVVNFNHLTYAHRVDQHAVILKPSHGAGNTEAKGGPGTPKDISQVEFAGVIDRTGPGALTRALLQCCNVWPHGEVDTGWQVWRVDRAGIWRARLAPDERALTLDPRPIKVFREAQPWFEIWPPGDSPIRPVYIADPYGQHSGDESCIMRWNVANAYRKGPSEYYVGPGSHEGPLENYWPLEYFWVEPDEEPGVGLCTGAQGHDFNAMGRTPRPRYYGADAACGRGNCAGQICVNDGARAARRHCTGRHPGVPR